MSSSAVYCMHMPWEVTRGVCALHGCLRFFIQICSKLLGSTVPQNNAYFASSSKCHIQRRVFLFLASLLVCCWIYHQSKCSQTWKTYICSIGHEVVPCCSPLTHWDAPRSDCGCGWHAVPGWLGPAQPSQTQSLLLGFADRCLSGRRLGRFGIHGGPLQLSWRVTRSFTSGWFFRGVLWVSMHDMTTIDHRSVRSCLACCIKFAQCVV